MSTEELVVTKFRELQPSQQREVLDFVEFLGQKQPKNRRYRSLYGLCADLSADISEEDIAEARKEMWGNFPREDF
jgi:hypothetical protein